MSDDLILAPGIPKPPDVGAALARHGIAPTLDAVVAAIADRAWYFTLEVQHGPDLPSATTFVASVWATADIEAASRRHGGATTPLRALGWPLVKLLDAQRPPRPLQSVGRE